VVPEMTVNNLLARAGCSGRVRAAEARTWQTFRAKDDEVNCADPVASAIAAPPRDCLWPLATRRLPNPWLSQMSVSEASRGMVARLAGLPVPQSAASSRRRCL
jgi:hypothetical protein